MSVRPMAYHRHRPAFCVYRRTREHVAAPYPPLRRRMVRMGSTSRVGWLVRASADGDEAAWTELVRQYAPLVMAVIRTYKLAPADAQDVSQTVWLRLVEHLANLREPEALPGWLTVTTRRACARHLQRGRWEQPVDPHGDERIEVS